MIAEQGAKHLTKHGVIVLEIGYNQGEAVSKLFEGAFDVTVMKDYSQNDRIVICAVQRCR